MKKLVLIDGNNFMFRSYYATAYSGNILKNSNGFPTNALYGFTSMINKIINEENPNYMVVAFDIGKNFRKKKYDFYKEGRASTPEELKMQMPIAREILDAMGIKHLELEPYEADDIIGSIVKMAEKDDEFSCTIISSDKDLLQLINFETDVKLLKQSGYIRYNEETFQNDYGIKPVKIIDLKALMGDTSDNIPGVKGIGEKTALKLLHEYESLDGIYENIDNIKGQVHDKLVSDKKNAYMSKEIATIYKDVPLDINLNNLKYVGPNVLKLNEIYKELEFHSLIKNDTNKIVTNNKYIEVNDEINIVLNDTVALYLALDNECYTFANIIGACLCDEKYNYYFNQDNLKYLKQALTGKKIITYDHKKNLYFMNLDNSFDDLMISTYLLNSAIKDNISSLGKNYGYTFLETNEFLKLSDDEKKNEIVSITRFLYDINNEISEKIIKEKLNELYQNIEIPLVRVLSKMEKNGIKVSKSELEKQGNYLNNQINVITEEIYNLAGESFNISSPKQLGEILFDKLKIGVGKKTSRGYKTDAETLEKLIETHPIVEKILEYRNYTKIKSTYVDGLISYIQKDDKVHTIFKQTIARTGRLSSIDPNLQNIPVREELGRNIRKAFLPANDIFLSSDYSQIELRVLSHMANCKKMIEAFNNGDDIHQKVAADINGVDFNEVTKEMRSKAKSVIFGIVYGISGFGLKENLHITKKEAEYFINKYYEMYPEVKIYMDNTKKNAQETGYVKTLFGRTRKIDELSSPSFMVKQMGLRMAINTPIQGTAADIIKLAMIEIDKKFEEFNFKSKMILQIHDELMFDVVKDEEEKVVSVVKDVMENIIKLEVPLKVSSDTGNNWYETK